MYVYIQQMSTYNVWPKCTAPSRVAKQPTCTSRMLLFGGKNLIATLLPSGLAVALKPLEHQANFSLKY